MRWGEVQKQGNETEGKLRLATLSLPSKKRIMGGKPDENSEKRERASYFKSTRNVNNISKAKTVTVADQNHVDGKEKRWNWGAR